MSRHLILTAAVFTLNAATLLLSLRGLAAPSASCFGCTFAHDAAWLAAFAAASWYAAFLLLRLPRGNTAQTAPAAAWLAAVQLYWLCALFADRAPSAAYSPLQIITAVLPHSWPFQTASCLLLSLLLRRFPLPQRKNVDNVKKV